MCQEEKYDLEKQLKNQALKAQKADELKLKHDDLLDKSKQLKSRHLLLIEKVKKHAESNCSNGQELTNVLAKLSSLSKIPLLSTGISQMDNSFNTGRRTQKLAKKDKSLIVDPNIYEKKSMMDPSTPSKRDLQNSIMLEAKQMDEEAKQLSILMMSESDLTES
jgi:hypothetical protein